MSLRDVSLSKPLLAKKGTAAPINPAVVRAGSVVAPLRPIESDGDVALESPPVEALSGAEAAQTGKQASESAPAASLLPFNLLRKKYRPDASPDLAEDEPDIVPADLAAPPESQPNLQAELALRTEPEPAVGPELRAPVETKPEPALKIPGTTKPESESESHLDAPVPTPNPEWRVGIEAMAPPKRATGGGWLLPLGALAAAFAALVVGWNLANPDIDLGFGPAPDSAAVDEASDDAATATIEPPPPIAESPALVEPDAPASAPSMLEPPADTAAVEPEPATAAPPESSLPEPILSPPARSEPATSETPADTVATELQPTQVETVTQVEPVAETVDPDLPELAPTSAPAAIVATPIKPTVDVVRLEASGEAVIAGRAAPNSELIVLDNGEPIGTVQADAFGEWVFVPEVALPSGDHEFGLVVKTVQESVNIPAPSKPSLPAAPESEPSLAGPESTPVAPTDVSPMDAAPGIESGTVPEVEASVAPADETPAAGEDATAAQPIPIPARKPEPTDAGAAPADDQAALSETPAAATADFVVQLASVKTRAGAEQEWRKLQKRFPEILSDMVPALDEVKLAEYGTVIRVRTGAFDSQRDAANLCAQLAAKSQACLVVKTSGSSN